MHKRSSGWRRWSRSATVASLVTLALDRVSAGAEVGAATPPAPGSPRPDAAAHGASPATSGAHGSSLYSLVGTVLPMLGGIALAVKTDGGVANTVAFAGLFWGGAIVGPSLGYVHGGATRRGLEGLALRAGAFAVAWALAPTHDFDDGIVPNPSFNLATGEGGGDVGIWILATAGILVSGIHDIIRVDGTVGARSDRVSSLHATVLPDAGGSGCRLGVEWRISF